MSFPNSPFSSGFPFDDRDFDRDRSHSSFRSQLDDLAKRHPEFAEHLNIGTGFPFSTVGRNRRSSDAEKGSSSQDPEFRRPAHDRPFARFDHFDFPFGTYFKDDDPNFCEYRCGAPEYQQEFSYTNQPPPEKSQSRQQSSQPTSPQPATTGRTEKPPQVPNFEGRKQNIQQSNTVDLGQKQEPVDENRGQRSMSAPPENRSPGQRFVSSINIPIQKHGGGGGGGDMGAKTSVQEPQPQQTNKSTERVIPIHVEGRDEPIIPKNVGSTFNQPLPPEPQPERIFGRNPSHFTQFLNKGEPHGMSPEDQYKQQQQQYQKQQQQNLQQQNQPRSGEQMPPPQSPHPQQSKSTQLEQIQNIQKDVSELMNQVEKFCGKPKDKEYLYLDEMLTRNLIKLDNIETEGKDNIRQARKEAIKCIEGCIGILEAKANANLLVENQKIQQDMEIENNENVEKQSEETQSIKKASEQCESVSQTSGHLDTRNKEEPDILEVSGVSRTGSMINETAPMEITDTTKENVSDSQVSNGTQETKDEKEIAVQMNSQEEKNDNVVNAEELKIETEEKNIQTDVEQMEVSAGTEINQNSEAETLQEAKKEKKKGRKKEKTDK